MSFLTFVLISLGSIANAQTFVSLEGDLTWQSRNDQRVPGEGGGDFSISDFKTGPFPGFRLYAGHIFNGRHEIRALYAPLAIEVEGQLDQATRFVNTTFSVGPTTAYYKFNSYRLTYAYHFDKIGAWRLALGFTGKIRDAEVRLTQANLRDSKKNVGFVPLLNFQAVRELSENWRFRFDMDGLAAPQGRAFDVALTMERSVAEKWSVFGGYRTIEGGADNKEVYNFAWIHKLLVGARGDF